MNDPIPGPAIPRDKPVYSVSRLNREVRMLLEHGLPVVWVEGELSNFARPSSGHWYFTLKDRDAQIRCAMFRMKNSGVRFTPKDGALVLARGRVGLYEARGDYQLIIEHMEEAGLGALKREFERLKAKLQAEGLFDSEAKRPLPTVPTCIGVVTSPTGAAIRDILHILRRRFPAARVIIYPSAVQGAAAVPELLLAIEAASSRAECDVLIVARGGGSLEDLWAFNDERVARALRAAPMPVVSGIGHEVDFTIADFVADVRAPTPSGAAEIVVPERRVWLDAFARYERRFAAAALRLARDAGQRLAHLSTRLRFVHPALRVQQAVQRLDDLEQRLGRAVETQHWQREGRLAQLISRLSASSPASRLNDVAMRHGALDERLRHAMRAELTRGTHRLAAVRRTLHAVSPLATLDRGFAIVTTGANDRLVMDASTLTTGELIRARVARGMVEAKVMQVIPASIDDEQHE